MDSSPAPEKRPVTVIAEALGPGRGGAELYLGHLARFLATGGYPVQIYVRRRSSEALEAMPDGVRVEIVPTMRRFRLVWERTFARNVARRLARTRPDIVLSTLPLPGITHYQPHSGLYRSAFAAIQQSIGPGLSRELYHVGNGLNLRRQSLVKMQERLFGSARPPQVMTFSSAVRNQLLSAYPSLSSRVVTVPQGVDLDRFHPGKEPSSSWRPERVPGHLALLFVAQNFRLKGLSSLLAAFRDALRQGLKADLLVVGTRTGSNRTFPAMARLLSLGSRVRFIGTVPDSEMPALYRSFDALVHPTFSDHCSLVVLEALACGLPVITTRQNGAAELMQHEKQGFILDRPDDIAALAASLLRLQDARKLSEMSAAAVALRPQIDFQLHARRVVSWLIAGPQSTGAAPS